MLVKERVKSNWAAVCGVRIFDDSEGNEDEADRDGDGDDCRNIVDDRRADFVLRLFVVEPLEVVTCALSAIRGAVNVPFSKNGWTNT